MAIFAVFAIFILKAILIEIVRCHGVALAKFLFKRMIRQMKEKMERAFHRELLRKTYADHVREHIQTQQQKKRDALAQLKREMIAEIKRAHQAKLDKRLRKMDLNDIEKELEDVRVENLNVSLDYKDDEN